MSLFVFMFFLWKIRSNKGQVGAHYLRSGTYECSEVDSANGPNLDHDFPMGKLESWKRHSLEEEEDQLSC